MFETTVALRSIYLQIYYKETALVFFVKKYSINIVFIC